MGILYTIIIGALCGWLAGNLMRGGGFGVLINIILGIVGGFGGRWMFKILNISIGSGVINDIIYGLTGSILILFLARLFKK